jgi:hypothetical protein
VAWFLLAQFYWFITGRAIRLALQKNHFALYVMTVYGDPATEAWLREAWRATGRKLDMGKSCIRFKRFEDVPLDVVGALIARVPVAASIARTEASLAASAKKISRKGK